jgi:hypothetical protein
VSIFTTKGMILWQERVVGKCEGMVFHED